MYTKLSNMPDGPWRRVAIEAQELGLELSKAPLTGTDATLIGAIDMIRQLREENRRLGQTVDCLKERIESLEDRINS